LIELDTKLLLNAKTQEMVALSGNSAMARGIIESGAYLISSYPGTPCAEIVDQLVKLNDRGDFYVEWSINEKVAFEVAAAAAIAGLRSVFITKHVGMNVAADPLMSICYAGIKGAMVIITADDPGAYDSPVEQDTRFYARMSEIACLEPCDQQEAKDIIEHAFGLSEESQLPVIIRTTNRILYGRGRVRLGEISKPRNKGQFEKGNKRWFVTGSNAVKQHRWLHGQQAILKEKSQECSYNHIEWSKNKEYGIIVSGVGYNYVSEIIPLLPFGDRISLFRLGCLHPLPAEKIKTFLSELKEVIVIEELEPFVEEGILKLVQELGIKISIKGKLSGVLQHTGALSPEEIYQAIFKLWMPEKRKHEPEIGNKRQRIFDIATSLPANYLTFCPGCPHRASSRVLKQAINKNNQEFVVTSDIGCYMFGIKRPFGLGDTVFCMGTSIGLGCGFSKSNINKRAVAIIGDSTFLHAGITALINATYTNADILIYIMDNRVIANTGLQPHPGIGITADGQKSKQVNIEDIALHCKADYVKVFDPFNVSNARRLIDKALRMEGQRVLIALSPCVRVLIKNKKLKAEKYNIIQDQCTQCMRCINVLACPAIVLRQKNVTILKEFCTGCGLCKTVCPSNAIRKTRI